MNEVLKQEVLQLIRTNDVAEAYLRLIPIVEEDDEAAELLLMMLVLVLILGLGGGNILKVLFHVFMTVITGGFWLLVLVIAFLVNHK